MKHENETVARVRKLVRGEKVRKPRGDRDTVVRSCPMFSDIHDMLCEGQPVVAVIKAIRSRGHLKGMSDVALEKALKRYRSHIDPTEIVEKRMPQMVIKAADNFKSIFTLMRELVTVIGLVDEVTMSNHALERMLRMLADGDMAGVQRQLNELLVDRISAAKLSFELRERLIRLMKDLAIAQRFLEHDDNPAVQDKNAITEDEEVETRILKRYNLPSGSKKAQAVKKVMNNDRSVFKVAGVVDKAGMGGEQFLKQLIQEEPELMLGTKQAPKFDGKNKKKPKKK